jgi:hypothetical protein
MLDIAGGVLIATIVVALVGFGSWMFVRAINLPYLAEGRRQDIGLGIAMLLGGTFAAICIVFRDVLPLLLGLIGLALLQLK